MYFESVKQRKGSKMNILMGFFTDLKDYKSEKKREIFKW